MMFYYRNNFPCHNDHEMIQLVYMFTWILLWLEGSGSSRRSLKPSQMGPRASRRGPRASRRGPKSSRRGRRAVGPQRQELIRAGWASRPAGRASELERAFEPAGKASEPADKERKRKKEIYTWYVVVPKAIIPYGAAAQKQVMDGRTI